MMLDFQLNIQEDSFQFSLELSVESAKNLYGKQFLQYLKENNFNYEKYSFRYSRYKRKI